MFLYLSQDTIPFSIKNLKNNFIIKTINRCKVNEREKGIFTTSIIYKSSRRRPNKYYQNIEHPKDFFFDCNTNNAKLPTYNALEDRNLKSFYKIKLV